MLPPEPHPKGRLPNFNDRSKLLQWSLLHSEGCVLREAIAALIVGLAADAAATDDRAAERRHMVETIERTALAVGSGSDHARLDARVLDAMRTVPRHEFVPAEVAHLAYA